MLPKSMLKREERTEDPRDVLEQPCQQVVEETAGASQPEAASVWHFGNHSPAEGAVVRRASVPGDVQGSGSDPELLLYVVDPGAQFACTLMDGFDLFQRQDDSRDFGSFQDAARDPVVSLWSRIRATVDRHFHATDRGTHFSQYILMSVLHDFQDLPPNPVHPGHGPERCCPEELEEGDRFASAEDQLTSQQPDVQATIVWAPTRWMSGYMLPVMAHRI
jgi:hypothetical protein